MKIPVFLLCFLAASATALVANVTKITSQEANRLVLSGKAVLVDVRESAEWAKTGVAAPAVLLPKSDFDGPQKKWKEFLDHLGDKEVILYCRTGHQAGLVGAALAAKGFKAANAGSFEDWAGAGLPVRWVKKP
jgi:rhodanese-related sulfurtransferase